MADATGSFAVVKTINTAFENLLKTFVHASDVFVAGIAIIAAAAVSVWFIYRCYLIMSGQVPDPMMPLIKDFAVKIVILTFAGATTGSAALYQDSVVNTLRDTPVAMVKVLTKEDNIYDFFEKKYNDIADFEDSADSGWFWQAGEKVNNALKMAALWIGFFILMLIVTVLMIIEKTFFMLGLGFGIIFVTFLAFESTKQYFSSWLSSVLGYGLSYVVTMYIIAKFLTEMGNMIKVNGNTQATWADIGVIVFLCFFFSVIISRVGDLVSSWFGSSNITDGTALTGVGAAAFSKNKILAVRGGAKSLVDSIKNRGQDKMNRYNTRHAYNKNREEAANRNKDKDKNKNTAIKQGSRGVGFTGMHNQNNKTNNNKQSDKKDSNTSNKQNGQNNANKQNSNNANKPNNPNSNMKGSSGFSSGNKGQSSGGSGANHTPRPRNTATHPPKLPQRSKK